MKTVDEFKGMKPEDVVKYIEGEPSISVVPVEPGLANMEKTDATGQRIVGLNTENAEINEGLVKERECVHSEGLYHPADVKPDGYKNRITGCSKQICDVCHVSAFFM